jgi:hypothetical protein
LHGFSGKTPKKTIPYLLCIQGGGALGAHAVGAFEEINRHNEFILMRAVGTSSGAASAYDIVTGWNDGLDKGGIDLAPEYAIARLKKLWTDLTRYQQAHMPHWSPSDSWRSLHLFPQLTHDPFHSAAVDIFGAVSKHVPVLQTESALRAFYRTTRGENHDAPPPRNENHATCSVNATLVTAEGNDWVWPPKNEWVFALKGLSPSKIYDRIGASGNIDDKSRPTNIGGKFFRDGAKCSPCPDMLGNARKCLANNWAMVILRTYPPEAHPPEHYAIGSDDWKRAILNSMMDNQIETIKRRFPTLPLCVVAPEALEKRRDIIFPPELCFDSESIARRIEAGRKAAARMLEHEFGICPTLSEPETTHKPAALAIPPMHAAASMVFNFWTSAIQIGAAPATAARETDSLARETAPASISL